MRRLHHRAARCVWTGGLAIALLGALVPASAVARPSAAIVEDFTSETVGTFPSSFSTPVGFWSIATNGVDAKPLLFEDGTQWAGSQAANNFANHAQAVSGAR